MLLYAENSLFYRIPIITFIGHLLKKFSLFFNFLKKLNPVPAILKQRFRLFKTRCVYGIYLERGTFTFCCPQTSQRFCLYVPSTQELLPAETA